MSKTSVNATKPELHILNEELENYFENTIIPQLYVDAELILRKFTPAAMKQFTLTSNDIGKNMNDVLENIRYPTIIENIKEVVDTGKIFEKEIQTTDFRWFQMNILPYLVRKKNKTDGVIITFVDITKYISSLKEFAKLNAEHDTFIYAVSHDIKQPLSSISLIADTLAHLSDNPAQFAKGIETLKRSVNNMKTLMNDFTDLIKSESKASRLHEPLNIENISADVIASLKDQIHNKDVTINTAFKIPEITFSRKNLRSILYNLLSNAIKYKKQGKPLRITVKTRKVKGYVLLTVEDNGMGMDKQHHKMIFKKMTRLNTMQDGTGMGLYIVSRMMKTNHGKIEVESTAGKGSIFKLFFRTSV